MIPHRPIAKLSTHEVSNTPPHLGSQDLWQSDRALQEVIECNGATEAAAHLAEFGKLAGADEIVDKASQANRYPPELHAFDRYGMRINQTKFHPAYHDLMQLAVENEVSNYAWNHPGQGAHVAHGALTYLFHQVEGGVLCPMAMAYSAIPPLRTTPAIAEAWIPRLLSKQYDSRDIPAEQKTGALVGMFMTEKQGGSDVRTNTTQAVPVSSTATGIGREYYLSGHKFFCSAPMCDAFLTLAYSAGGLSCFLIPRWTPDGERNGLNLQRIKDKLGNRSNASTEMELENAWGVMVGEEGRGIRTIIDMVQHNRVYCANASAGTMRQALVQALHHTQHRHAFGNALIDQPLMQNVLADLALETEAALNLSLRIARGACGFVFAATRRRHRPLSCRPQFQNVPALRILNSQDRLPDRTDDWIHQTSAALPATSTYHHRREYTEPIPERRRPHVSLEDVAANTASTARLQSAADIWVPSFSLITHGREKTVGKDLVLQEKHSTN